jgi:hypothetical protein
MFIVKIKKNLHMKFNGTRQFHNRKCYCIIKLHNLKYQYKTVYNNKIHKSANKTEI